MSVLNADQTYVPMRSTALRRALRDFAESVLEDTAAVGNGLLDAGPVAISKTRRHNARSGHCGRFGDWGVTGLRADPTGSWGNARQPATLPVYQVPVRSTALRAEAPDLAVTARVDAAALR